MDKVCDITEVNKWLEEGYKIVSINKPTLFSKEKTFFVLNKEDYKNDPYVHTIVRSVNDSDTLKTLEEYNAKGYILINTENVRNGVHGWSRLFFAVPQTVIKQDKIED